MSYFIGAYASSPNVDGWDADLETAYYNELKKLPNVKGLEHPFLGSLHPHDDDWFLANIAPEWNIVLTCIPGIMTKLGNDSNFGLASEDEQGRQDALAFMQQARAAIVKLNTHAQRQVVTAIEIQSAPNTSLSRSSSNALKRSLETMLTWDWQGAQIIIEHCDKVVEGQKAAKGFLSLEDEIQVLIELNNESARQTSSDRTTQNQACLNQKLGISINWGRSVLEARHVDGAVKQIEKAKSNGLLSGVIFSGVSDQESEYGCWEDTHMPPKPNAALNRMESLSLLTETEIHKCLSFAGGVENPPSIVGIKLGIRPYNTGLIERVAYNQEALMMLDAFYQC